MPFSRATKDAVRRTFLLELQRHGVPCTSDQSRLLGSATFQAALDATLDELYRTVDLTLPVEVRVPLRVPEDDAYSLYRTYVEYAGIAGLNNGGFLGNGIVSSGWKAVAQHVRAQPYGQAVLPEALYRVYRGGAGLAPAAYCLASSRIQGGFRAVARRVNSSRAFDAPTKTPGELHRERWAAKHGYAPGTIDAWADLPHVVQEAWELQAAELEKARAAEAAEHFRFV